MTLLSGDLSDLNTVRTTGTFTGKGAVDYTATDASISIANANSLSGATNGVVTATITESTTAQILDAGTGLTTDGGANAFTIDISNTSADAGDLASIHAKTSLTVALDTVETLTGTFTCLLYTSPSPRDRG